MILRLPQALGTLRSLNKTLQRDGKTRLVFATLAITDGELMKKIKRYLIIPVLIL